MNVFNYPILLSSTIVPLVISIILPVVWKILRNVRILMIISTLSLIYPFTIFTWILLSGVSKQPILDPIYFSHPLIGKFSMLSDGISTPVAFGIALVTSFIAIYSVPYMKHRFEEMVHEGITPPSWGIYYMLYTMFSAAMIGTVLSTNLIEFYIFFELTLIPSFLLIAFYGYGERMRIAIMYLLWTHIGALTLLIGILVYGFNAGTFDIINPETGMFNIGLAERTLPLGWQPSIFALMTIGLLVKMAVFGVHIWLPYAHAEAPTPLSALLSPNLIGIGAYALIRIPYTLFPSIFESASIYLYGWAILTMIYGGLMALAQDDFKRFLAYSSISQMGYLLLGISSLTILGITGSLIHYVAHAVGKALLFMSAGVLIATLHGLRSISKMGGLAIKMPYTASLALIGFMHITGIPPSLGLWSEVFIVLGAIDKALHMGPTALIIVVIGLLVAIGLSTSYSFITMKRIFFGEISEKLKEESREGVLSLIIPMVIIAAIGILSFFLANVFIEPTKTMLESLSEHK
ncbi:MAG: proton-conducting transporter membrane subunit [Candidatus Methanomethylicia archaeon]